MGSSANHNLDETAIVGRSLQKLLIFFMVLDAVFLVFGGSFFGSLMSFIFHFIVLTGVQRRRTGILMAYVVLNVIMLSLGAVCLLFVVGALMTMDNTYYNDDLSASSSADYSYTNMNGVKSALRRNLFSLNSLSSSEAPSADVASASSDSYEASSMMLAASILLLISVILLYCKIYSVVLAARLRRLLLASPVLPVHIALPVSGVHDNAPEDSKPLLGQESSATFDDTNPVFTQPGFVPMQPQLYYPNMQGAPAMMPAPFMYGQHPVFYTFAPTNEKQ